ncbi:polysaccharide biosynthesis/export family protein [Aliiroseovarius crassostreae]|uniref:polysaccharide biosynthesis/export family protein n=1 Tax=Aliiroseovarius crassostreae TaxID=154981 RepID=UPI00220A5B23|nr:polysaccharide biosynthesis/export family protein [Aliiroseovarius crassostreae]UWQ00256.1 polysaccharide export protein [Aliiroseovarius crassostreae]
MSRNTCKVLLCLVLLGLSGCAIPRGAALSSEILSENSNATKDYQVVQVGRGNVPQLADWPKPAVEQPLSWISNTRGSQAELVRKGDEVSLVIWEGQENSLLAPATAKQAALPPMLVSPTGMIFIPYLGDVKIANMTPEAARQKIQKAMENIAPSAQVQLSVGAGQRNSAALVGGVSRPGSYPLLNRDYSVLNLLAEGGGVLPDLRNPILRLLRRGRAYEVRVDKLLSNPEMNTPLLGGDKIVVEEDKRFFTALGSTGREELVYFDRDQITALEALSMIGGLSDTRANLNAVLVLRDYAPSALRQNGLGPEKEQVVFAFDLTTADGLFAARKFQINPQDTVLGTETIVSSARTVLGVIGAAVGIGASVNNISN